MSPRSHRPANLRSKLHSAALEPERQARPPALESTPAAALRVAFAFENHVETGTEDLLAAGGGKEWVKRNRRESTEGGGGRRSGMDGCSRIDSFEAGRRKIGLVGWGKRVGKEWSFEISVGQAGEWFVIGPVGDEACPRSSFACGFAEPLAG